MQTINRPSVAHVVSASPKWMALLLALQGLTLLAALGAQPGATPAEAGGQRRPAIGIDDDEPKREPVLPNAAGQRQEQIRLLTVIADQLVAVNAKLDETNKKLDQPEARDAQP